MAKTSHKQKRPIAFKLIDLVEPHPILYLRQMPGMSAFEMMKTKNLLWQEIASEMGYPVQFCLNRWSNLRRLFQKELKHRNDLCTKTGLIKVSTWPYLNRLKFLENIVQSNEPKKQKITKRKLKPKRQIENKNVSIRGNTVSGLSEEYEHEFYDDITDKVHASNTLDDTYEDDFSIIEEIDAMQPKTSFSSNNTNSDNYNRIQLLLSSFEGGTLNQIERRLMAFLCKCQLRGLFEQTIDDLFI